jgi:TonB family protein
VLKVYRGKAGAKHTGNVLIEVVVSDLGCVLDARLLNGVSPTVDAEVLALALRRLSFKPALADGSPVASYVTLSFSLSDGRFTDRSAPPK